MNIQQYISTRATYLLGEAGDEQCWGSADWPWGEGYGGDDSEEEGGHLHQGADHPGYWYHKVVGIYHYFNNDKFLIQKTNDLIFLLRFPSVKAAMLTMLEECRILKTTVLQTKQDLTAMATQLQVILNFALIYFYFCGYSVHNH